MADPSTVLHVAAFTDERRGGNPAGVVLDARDLDDSARLALAASLGYSESAFAEPTDDPRTYGLRFFSPVAEVGFCGHATIATAVALAERDGAGELLFRTSVGPVPIQTRRDADGVRATLTSVPAASTPVDADVLASALDALRWAPDDLDPHWPPHVAFGGMHHLVLVARRRDRLADLGYDVAALGALMAEQDWITVSLLWPESATRWHARNPFPPGGVYEDPATGAAAAALGGYLRTLGRVPGEPVTVLQGEDMGQPCRLVVDASAPDGRVRVSGTGALVDVRP